MKLWFGLIFITLFYVSPLVANPLAEWRMDEDNFTGFAGEVRDSSGNNYHGTAINGLGTRDGVVCRAGDFRGEGYNADPLNTYYPARYHVEVPGSSALSPYVPSVGSAMTITGWFNTRRTDIVGTIIHKGDGGASQDYRVFLQSNRLNLQVYNIFGNSETRALNFSISPNVNYFFTATILRSRTCTASFFGFCLSYRQDIDIQLEIFSASSNTPLASEIFKFQDFAVEGKTTNGTLLLGATKYAVNNITNYFDGVIDEIRLYPGVRTRAENLADKNASRVCSGALQCLADNFPGALSTDSWVTSISSGNFAPQVVNGRLRLTQAIGNQATSATYQRLYPSANNRVVVEFDYWAYGGNGADGLAVVLSDATITPQAGSFGGPLGYGFKPGIPGFAGGWLGFGLDEYGNFSNEGGTTNVGFRPQSVVIRGSGSGTNGYNYLRGSCSNGTINQNSCLSPAVDGNQSTPHRYRFIIDTRSSGSTIVSVERNTGNGFTSLIAPFNAQSVSGQTVPPENFLLSFTGSTGGSNNIHELDNISICALRSNPVGQQIDHIELTHQATGIACVASAVQVKACLNADCSTLFTSPVSVDLSNSAGNWQTDPITLTNGVGTAYLRNPGGGVATIGVTETVPPRKAFSQTVCKVGSNSSNCQINFANAGLLFAQADGVTPLSHQTAGVAFNGVLRAIRTNTTTGACEARAEGSKPVRLGFSCENPSSCIAGQQFSINNTQIAGNGAASSANRSSVNLTFNSSGSAPLTMRYSDVGQLALHASLALPEQSPDPAITLNGSSNAFVVRPHTLAVVQALRQNGSANPATQTGGNGFVAASEPFNVVIEARNADGQATPNFGKELNRQRGEAVFNQLVYPPSGNNGTFNGGAVDTAIAALNGRQTVTGVSWNEAGSITLQAKMLNDTYLGIADISAKPASAVIGRFYPDNFALVSSEVSNSCTNFSYMSQPALTVNYQLEAKGRGGNTLQNYHSAHYPAGAATMLTVAQDNSTRLAAERLAVQAAQWQHGVYRVQQNNASFNRVAAPDGPYTNMQLGLQIVSEQDSRNFPAFTLGTDALALSGTLNMRYGRLVLQNSGGPEDEPVPLAFKTEYWQGGRFINNIEDNCSLISNSSALLSTISGTPALSMTGVGGMVQNGRFPAQSLTLAPPGVPGIWQVEYMAEPWLQYHWRGASANYQQNPQAEIMFGRFRGNPRQIFWRELFR
ncbi:DUF6701 domain-containing protein [Rheinheimera hassiensis]|uniref:DUF6701 domain-containing protein n=1 Tax=Rheinheimera hassiensis TaxID=1193627 RepID=UPI001F0602C7|nr:DUF6701 domain-containing protein [Rheinheimera hassiensis]